MNRHAAATTAKKRYPFIVLALLMCLDWPARRLGLKRPPRAAYLSDGHVIRQSSPIRNFAQVSSTQVHFVSMIRCLRWLPIPPQQPHGKAPQWPHVRLPRIEV